MGELGSLMCGFHIHTNCKHVDSIFLIFLFLNKHGSFALKKRMKLVLNQFSHPIRSQANPTFIIRLTVLEGNAKHWFSISKCSSPRHLTRLEPLCHGPSQLLLALGGLAPLCRTGPCL